MTAHSVVWSHDHCSYVENVDCFTNPDCSPTGTVICSAAPDAPCHLSCDEYPCSEYGWHVCRDCKAAIAVWLVDEDHSDCDDPSTCLHVNPVHPEALHCVEGHAFQRHDSCNVVESLPSDVLNESYDSGWPEEFHDGPIRIRWDYGDVVWSYAPAEVTA